MKKDSPDCPKKKPREKSKTRAWEKERRDRLSECFNNLMKVLPNYDASRTLSKIDILNGATSTIKDLDEKLKNIIIATEDKKNEGQKFKLSADLIKKLQDRVKKLLVRNEELVNLLKNAGIKVPSVFGGVKKMKSVYTLSKKITTSQVKLLQKELEKENQVKPPKPPNPKKPKRNLELKFKKNSSNSKNGKFPKRQVMNMGSSSNCVFIVSQPRLINNSCYFVSRNPRKINQTVISHSPFVKTPIVSSNVKPSNFSTHARLSDLGPGTLLFANGTVMPIVPTPSPLSVLPTIITNPVQPSLPTFIVVSCNAKTLCTNKISVSTDTKATLKSSLDHLSKVSKSSVKDSVCNSLTRPALKPKSCVTKTTQINKVPIPALSSKYNRHLCLEDLEPQNKEKTDKLDNSNNKVEKVKEPVLNKKSNKRIIHKQLETDVKIPKIDTEASEKNIEKLASAADSRLIVQPSVSQVEEPVSSTECQKLITEVIKEITVDKPQDKKIETSTSSIEFSKIQTITVKPLDDIMASLSNQEPYQVPKAESLKNNTSKEVSKAKELLNNYISTEYKAPKNTKNVEDIIEDQIQTKMCSKAKMNCEPLIPTTAEITLSDNTPVTTSANKKEIKPFEVNISHSDSPTKNNNANDLKSLEINLPQSELSNDIFASFQVPPSCQNPGSTSPTAAFLLAFPLVSSGTKVTEVIGDENSESHAGTPNLLQIGTMDIPKPTQSYSDSLTPSLLTFENFSFFSNKDCGGFYNNCSIASTTCQTSTVDIVSGPKVTTSFNSNTTVPTQNVVDTKNKNNPLKVNINDNLKLSSNNKADSMHNKSLTQNNFKMDVSGRVPTNSKSNNISTHQETLQSSKEKAQLYSGYGELGGTSTNIVNINPSHYSSKSVINDTYLNKPKSNMPAQGYISKSSDNCTNYAHYRDCSSFVTNSVVVNKNYNPVYTSAGNNNYFYNSSGSLGDSSNFNLPNCNNYSEYRKSENFSHNYNFNSQVYDKEKCNQNVQTKIKTSISQNKPINWMTTPSTTVSYKPDYFLPPFSKEPNFNANLSGNMSFNTLPANTYFNTSSVYNSSDHLNSTSDIRKTVDLSLPTYSSYQRTENEENQFSWSPNKMPQFLDPAHSHTFVSSTLPTLVGDLALNNTPNLEQKQTKDKNRDNRRKVGHCDNQNGQTNFLSVSQLVENSQEHVPAKVMSRRNSGNRSKTNTKAKRVINRSEANKDISLYQKNDKVNQQKHFGNISVASNLFSETKQQSRNNKSVPSSYSAEALIGNQISSDSSKRNISSHNKAIVPNFLSENLYFPAVDVSQDNGFIQTNQSFQANSFSQNYTTTFQNNTYGPNNFIPSACTIPSTYIPNNNFMHNSNAQEFLGENPNIFQNNSVVQSKDKSYIKNCYRQHDKDEKNESYCCKKVKKRSANESTLPSFDIPFLSMPGNINSPILPDDFHTTYLPPTTLYSCKNPLYSKPNSEIPSTSLIPSLPTISGSKSGIQHPDLSSSVNSVGTSLTNFNLSTIFPEINKGPVQDTFPDTRNKDYHPVSKSFSMSSSLQVPFSTKSSIPFGSFGT